VLQSRVTAIDGQKFENSQEDHPGAASASEALQAILDVLKQALSDGSNDDNIHIPSNIRGSLDHSTG
jgi:hypothetical protein